ncbi:thioesterase domain-containing protein [Neobacillus mesonae]|nr:thioesterase domain-containing protein [Neobacillus mesonae]
MYEPMKMYLREWIEVIPIEYAGHGLRVAEEFYPSFKDMIDDAASQIIERLDGKPYAILGYSMGSLIAYEVYYEICKRASNPPAHLFFAAHLPPDVPRSKGDTSFRALAKRLEDNLSTVRGGSVQVLDYKELLEMIIPRYQTDLHLYNSYRYEPKEAAIDANITIIYSGEDNPGNQIFEWSKHSSKFCLYQHVRGDHFFINSETEEVSNIVNRVLVTELSI